MSPLKSNRLAWSVAFASLTLWAASAPVTWSQQVAAGASSLFAQTADENSSTTTSSVDLELGDTSIAINDGSAQVVECPTPVLPPAISQLLQPTPVPPTESTTDARTFQICGANPQAESDIASFIGGRGVSVTLVSHGDGCAVLTVRPTSQPTNGSSSSNLSVSLGSGRNLSIQIVSEQGATHATITVR